MKVFISWSGERSKRVAEYLRVWLKSVIQSADPFVSSKDIENGSWWFSEISEQLASASTGILCITNENKDKPWILFEAGAISKGQSKNRAMPFLIDTTKSEIKPPLTQLHLTEPTYEELYSLASTINAKLDSERRLEENILKNTFNAFWPQFQNELNKIITETSDGTVATQRSDRDILEEVLSSIRSFDERTRLIEVNLPNPKEIFNTNSHKYRKIEADIERNIYNPAFIRQYVNQPHRLIDDFAEDIFDMSFPKELAKEIVRDIFVKKGILNYALNNHGITIPIR